MDWISAGHALVAAVIAAYCMRKHIEGKISALSAALIALGAVIFGLIGAGLVFLGWWVGKKLFPEHTP